MRRAPRPCSVPGCPTLVHTGSHCPEHANNEYDHHRGSASSRGYGRKWAAYRERFIAEHPHCTACEAEGVTTPTEHVDHIVPVSGPDDPGFWPTSNHQPLCKSHHSAKTARERGHYQPNRGEKAAKAKAREFVWA